MTGGGEGPLISAAELLARLGKPGVRVVDGSWYLPIQNRDPRAEFRAGHIPGAVFFDIDIISDQASDYPHMLPRTAAFAEAAGALGLSDVDEIVVYDGIGHFSAPRVRWMLLTFGAQNVRVLDGGLPAWIAAGGKLESGPASPARAVFKARFSGDEVRDRHQVATALATGEATVMDARPAGRFTGEVPEPRPGVRGGHMPGSVSFPADRMSDENGMLRSPTAIKTMLANAGIDLDRPVIATCGSGVTAAVLTLALEVIGKSDSAIYDGSWSEWGGRSDTPVVTGKD